MAGFKPGPDPTLISKYYLQRITNMLHITLAGRSHDSHHIQCTAKSASDIKCERQFCDQCRYLTIVSSDRDRPTPLILLSRWRWRALETPDRAVACRSLGSTTTTSMIRSRRSPPLLSSQCIQCIHCVSARYGLNRRRILDKRS